MTAIDSAAIAGGGVAGLASAILLAEAGIRVDLYDARTTRTALGSGITLQGNALRALDRLGVWGEVQRRSYSFDLLDFRAPDAAGTLLATVSGHKTGGEAYPATAGMYRPDLADILTDRALDAGVRVHDHHAVVAVDQDERSVGLTLSNGSVQRADLLIGADGLNSTVRGLVGIDAKPRSMGLGIWRAFVPRVSEVQHTALFYGGGSYYAGYCPTSDDWMYAYIVDDLRDRSGLLPKEAAELMADLSLDYHGPWDELRDDLRRVDTVNYTGITELMLDGDWNRGRVVVIGDAAHSCPPTLAQGAAQAFEDALVLADVLATRSGVDESLWSEFHSRRVDRVTTVVRSSVLLTTWQRDRNAEADTASVMRSVGDMLAVPA